MAVKKLRANRELSRRDGAITVTAKIEAKRRETGLSETVG
jgi:hypothetical protein